MSDLIIDDRHQARFKVHRSAFVSDEVLALERERVFGKCWLYLGHTSELKKPGDFISRRVGGRPLLYTRDRESKLNALYNTCSHRGAMVCRERSGNRRAFTCGYHAWTFDEKGRFIGMPGREALPPDATENCKLDLVPVERMEEFKGFVFVCYDRNAMSLTDYLAGAGEYLAYVADQGRDGMEIVTGTQDYCVGANWKLLQENSADGYHGVPTHSTYFDYIRSRDNATFTSMNSKGWVKNLGNGHAVSESIGLLPWGRPYARWAPGWGEEAKVEVEALNKEIMERLGPGARQRRRQRRPQPADLPQPRGQRRDGDHRAHLLPGAARPHGSERLVHRAGRRERDLARPPPAQLRRVPRDRRASPRPTTSRCSSSASAATPTWRRRRTTTCRAAC